MDLSQEALAEKVGVSRQTINAIEKGDYNPTIKLCISICKVLNKTLDELFWEQKVQPIFQLVHQNTLIFNKLDVHCKKGVQGFEDSC